MYAKMLTFLGTTFLIFNIAFDKAETILYWKDPEKRPVILNIKMKQSFIETLAVFFVNFIIIILSQNLGLLDFLYERVGVKYFTSYYQPPLFEIILITIITTLSIIAIWTSMYWGVSRFIQIKKYSHKFKILEIKKLGLFICLMIPVAIFWFFLLIPDILFIAVKMGNFEGILIFKEFAQKNYRWILMAQIPFLIGLNLLFYFLGDKNMSERDNFVLLEKENSEIKSKKEKDQKRVSEKPFKIAVYELMIVNLIFMPLIFILTIFYLTWLPHDQPPRIEFYISVPFLLVLGTMVVDIILYGAIMSGRISIIKSKSRQSIEC